MDKGATGRKRKSSALEDNSRLDRERQIPYNLRKRPRNTQRAVELDAEQNDREKRKNTGCPPRKRRVRTEQRGNGRGRGKWDTSFNTRRSRNEPLEQNKITSKQNRQNFPSEEERLRKMLWRLGHAVVEVCACANQEERKVTFEALEYFLDLLGHSSLGEESVFVTALALLDKVTISKNPITITPDRVCELFCGLTLLASKFLRDLPTWNWEASRLVSLERIHKIEYELLDCLDWDVWVSEDEFSKCKAVIMR